jgi:signal transduction histidine kinase
MTQASAEQILSARVFASRRSSGVRHATPVVHLSRRILCGLAGRKRRPRMNRNSSGLVRSNVAGALASALVLLAVGIGCFYFSEKATGLAREAFAIGETDRQMGQLFSIMLEAESSQRGFLITQDDKYLTPYQQAAISAPEALATLKAQIAALADTAPLPSIGPLEALVSGKFDELARTVDLAKAGRRDEAMAVVHDDSGLALTRKAREFVSDFRRQAADRRQQRVDAMRTSVDMLEGLTTLGGGLIVLLSILAIMQIRRYTREIESARMKLSDVNLELERRVETRTRDLVRANEEIQRYAYIVSHDLRAPLVNIMGFTSELEQASTTLAQTFDQASVEREAPQWRPAIDAVEHDIPEALGFIKTSMTRMDGLINEILRLSRLGRVALQPEWIDMRALIENCIAQIQHRLDSEGVEARIEGVLPNVVGDRSSLEQIFSNLLDNAVKYLSEDRKGSIRIRGRVAQGTATFEVQDNGRGVAMADRQRIFDLFRRAGPQDRPGEGIGLAHVRTLVRRMTGEINVISDGRTGTIFTVGFPADIRLIPTSASDT